jgi:hypothetical protein
MQLSETYGTDSRSYLKRSRIQLDSQSYRELFYAAFELRCGIEARVKEYIDGHAHIPTNRKKEWRLSNIDKMILKYFGETDIVTQVIIHLSPPLKKVVCYYTPVTPELIAIGQKLGDLLHAQSQHRSPEDAFWKTTKDMLENTYKLLEISNKGTLMGPPLWKEKGKSAIMILMGSSDEETESYKKIMQKGDQFTVEIKHLNEFPAE